MEQIRSFIAIELPNELKQALTRLQDQLKSGSNAPVKWVSPHGVHLTLKFLGNISPEITGKITTSLEEAIQGIHPFHLEVKGLGVFPNPRRVNIIWVGLTGALDRLAHLQQRIESSLENLGFARESRTFTPHLTLARLRDQATPDERQTLGRLVADVGFKTGYSLEVDSIHLMKSQLTREGAVYSRISSVQLR